MLGATVQVASLLGLAAGLSSGAALAPVVSRLGGSPFTRALLSLATVVVVTGLIAGLARTAGLRAWRAIRRGGLARFDSAAGVLVAGGGTLLACWILASTAARLPTPGLASQIQDSAILRSLDRRLPPPPTVFARLGPLFNPLRFPDVFPPLEP